MNQNLLQQLRDIHLPKPISWWPLAPAWYVLILLLAVISAYIIFHSYQHLQKKRAKKLALQQVEQLKNSFNPAASSEIIEHLSILLRRVALAKFPRYQVAGLAGNKWLEFLYQTSHLAEFQQPLGQVLITAPYGKQVPPEAINLFPLVKNWIEINA